jgi:hypothetical protein
MNQQQNINAPKANATSLNRVAGRPFADGVLYSNEMKMIEDLGMLYRKATSRKKHHYAIFECPFCGKHFQTSVHSVKHGDTKSCGCMQYLFIAKARTVHGTPNKKIHDIWHHMKQRCLEKTNPSYPNYGGRGIFICEEWLRDYMSFYNWACGSGYKDGLQIDRINNDDGYYPDNCRWATAAENCQNRRKIKNTKFKYKGINLVNGKYRSYIKCNGRSYHLGTYSTEKEAALAYNKFVIKHNSKHILNIIEDE